VVELVDRRPLFKLIEKEAYPDNPPCLCVCYYEITARIEDLPPRHLQGGGVERG
jgi:hypothetical protein